MDNTMNVNSKSCFGGCLASCVGLFIVILMVLVGQTFYGEMSTWTVLFGTAALLGIIAYITHEVGKRYTSDEESIKEKDKALKAIALKYNAVTKELENKFNAESNQNPATRLKYQKEYLKNKSQFEQERDSYTREWETTHNTLGLKKTLRWCMIAGMLLLLGACSFSIGLKMPPSDDSGKISALVEKRTWSADNIPMPHMDNHTKYVSNPDSIISEAVVDSMNSVLLRLDDQLGIESAFVIVGHIEGDDPVAMVRGIYEKYHVGRNDRGLVVVVGYLDHSYFIAPGQSLEGDLTDLECNHLAQDYLIPSMKAELPDSGMLYLAKGVYALMTEKEMPQMSSLTAAGSNDDDEGPDASMMIFMGLFCAWIAFASKKKEQLGLSNIANKYFLASPFISNIASGTYAGGSSYGSSRHSDYGGGGGFSGGGSSYSGGGYGGGSWGGGGSGGRW